jgi:glycosyltransferase involved in cell wall biosynthesis
MAQDPLNVLWVEPHFPGRLGALADWLVRRRGYRCWFYCHTADARELWPSSAGQGLEVQVFGVGGVAREKAVAWTRALERGLCYAYGCWEILESRRPRPIDLVVGRSSGLGSTLFASVYAPAAPVVNLVEYYFHPHQNDLAEDAGPNPPPAYTHWRRSANAMELLDLEQCTLAWTQTHWQRHLFPAEYRDDLWVQHDGVDSRECPMSSLHERRSGRRTIAGRAVPQGTRVVTFVARALDRLRGFDRFWQAANALLKARPDVICVIVGEPIVQRGLDISFHNRDYLAHLRESSPPVDPERLWFLPRATPAVVSEALAASDLHIAPGRPYPIARSLLEAMAAGCVVLASDTPPHREILSHGQDGLLFDPGDPESVVNQALAVLGDPPAHRPLGDAAAELARSRFSREVCLPAIAERFWSLAAAGRRG